jgi:hypothetical protein
MSQIAKRTGKARKSAQPSAQDSTGVSPALRRQLQNFDHLPNDALVFDAVAALVLGVSLKTLQRKISLPARRISERRLGRRVGDIRALARGEAATA